MKFTFKNFNFTHYNFFYVNLLSKEIEITENDNYSSYICKCLYNYFHDHNSMNNVKQRLTMDFFTIKDILNILNFTKLSALENNYYLQKTDRCSYLLHSRLIR